MGGIMLFVRDRGSSGSGCVQTGHPLAQALEPFDCDANLAGERFLARARMQVTGRAITGWFPEHGKNEPAAPVLLAGE